MYILSEFSSDRSKRDRSERSGDQSEQPQSLDKEKEASQEKDRSTKLSSPTPVVKETVIALEADEEEELAIMHQDWKNETKTDTKQPADFRDSKKEPKNGHDGEEKKRDNKADDKKPKEKEGGRVEKSDNPRRTSEDEHKKENDDLPHPWRQVLSSKGQVYYYNEITDECVWDRPVAPKEKEKQVQKESERRRRSRSYDRSLEARRASDHTGRIRHADDVAYNPSSKRRRHDVNNSRPLERPAPVDHPSPYSYRYARAMSPPPPASRSFSMNNRDRWGPRSNSRQDLTHHGTRSSIGFARDDAYRTSSGAPPPTRHYANNSGDLYTANSNRRYDRSRGYR